MIENVIVNRKVEKGELLTESDIKVPEKPILFNSEMVLAILEGRKTQTRRVIKKPRWADPKYEIEIDFDDIPIIVAKVSGCQAAIQCPYGESGDELWVRETHTIDYAESPPIDSNGNPTVKEVIVYKATDNDPACYDGKWIPSIFMFREYSRIQLRVKELRVERIQDISESDCLLEGVLFHDKGGEDRLGKIMYALKEGNHSRWELSAKDVYKKLWDSINKKQGFGWETNPLSWVVEFEIVNA